MIEITKSLEGNTCIIFKSLFPRIGTIIDPVTFCEFNDVKIRNLYMIIYRIEESYYSLKKRKLKPKKILFVKGIERIA